VAETEQLLTVKLFSSGGTLGDPMLVPSVPLPALLHVPPEPMSYGVLKGGPAFLKPSDRAIYALLLATKSSYLIFTVFDFMVDGLDSFLGFIKLFQASDSQVAHLAIVLRCCF